MWTFFVIYKRNIHYKDSKKYKNGITGKVAGIAEKPEEELKRGSRERPVDKEIVAVINLVKNVYWRDNAAKEKNIPVIVLQ